MKESIEEIADKDGRYHAGALKFVHDGLTYSVHEVGDDLGDEASRYHISGQELCKGLAELAKEKWGRLGKTVLNRWGVKNTRDFGEIVYLMIEHQWMNDQPGDSIDDFNDVYDFKTVFEDEFEF